jgi:hypothetical protein
LVRQRQEGFEKYMSKLDVTIFKDNETVKMKEKKSVISAI